MPPHAPAQQPDDLPRLFLERVNAGDVEGLLALYEPTAVLAFPPGQLAVGHDQIRQTYERLLATRPTFTPGPQAPTIRNGDYALTSTSLPTGGATAEVAHRQPDDTWRWILDNPNILTRARPTGADPDRMRPGASEPLAGRLPDTYTCPQRRRSERPHQGTTR